MLTIHAAHMTAMDIDSQPKSIFHPSFRAVLVRGLSSVRPRGAALSATQLLIGSARVLGARKKVAALVVGALALVAAVAQIVLSACGVL